MKSLFPSEEKSVLRSLGGLSPVLSCIRTLTDSDDHFSDLKAPILDESCFRFLRNEPCVKNGNGFCMAISLVDGNTLFVSSTITSVLGYPKDMVVGTCIMNYLYPRDRVTFASQLTQGLQSRFCDSAKTMTHNQTENTFYCRIRQYHSLKCGYGVSDKKNVYKPFQVTIRVRDVSTDDPCVEDDVQTTCLIAVAVPLVSAYKTSEEIPAMSSFSTRHTASCHFSHMDSSAIPYLGFLPQDVLGFSIFDFYHMDDMPQLKDIYELVVKEQGCSFRSKPYRMKAFNGCYVVLETEWSCFINPWSRKLEFVLGQHRVLKGPVDANVFGENMKEDGVVSDEILKESQRIQEEIKNLLSQPVKNHVNDGLRSRCPKRKRGLASFVSSLVDVCQGEEQNWNKEECSCSDHGSVVMGEISPHQEFNDSDPSSVTPPTSQEIRYQENIDRFFASHPKTYSSDGSGDCKANFKRHQSSNTSVDKESRITSADSGNGSMQTHSDESVKATTPTQNGAIRNTTHEKYPAISSLTEDLLSQHNRIIHHKYNAKQRKVKTNSSTNVQLRKDSHRMKRGSSPHLPDGGPHKHNKASKSRAANVPNQAEDSTSNEQSQPSTGVNPMSGFSLNPPLSMGSFPSMSHTSSSTPWNNSSITASYVNPVYNPGVPNFGMPNYLYMGGAAATGAAPSPFFMPVMYMGAMPFYPSIPPMMTQTPPAGVWPFNFGPACSMGLSTPVNAFNQTNLHPQNGQVLPPPQTTSNAQTTNTPAVDAKSTVRPQYENMDTNQTNASSPKNRNRLEKQSTSNDLGPRSNNNKTNVDNCERNNIANPPIKTSSAIASCLTGSVTFTQSGDSSTRTACRIKVTGDNQRTYNRDSDPTKEQSDQEKDLHDDSASLSSSYLLKSDDLSCQSPSERAEDTEMESKEYKKRPLLKDPPWMDGINMNSETIYRFQLPSRSLEDILKKDLEALKSMNQPNLVGKQLAILQAEINETAREKREERTAMDTDGDQEPRAGPSKAETAEAPAFSPTGSIRLGFDTLEEDVQEEVQYREAEMMIYMVGPQITEGEDEVTEPEDEEGRESQESAVNKYRPI